ncbi:MAG TPA: GGDEF domain-containing protein, partial [Gammaproteobacteria bacterium]|nr:GGDEF domain-containing protein [Gammaproteobacteria bacterium]
KHVNYPIEVQNHRLHISGSIGVTFFPLDHSGPDALLRHAHEAMYQAKGKNRSGFHLYDPVQDQQLRQRQQMREDFALALQSDQQLMLYYQPKVDLSDGRVIGLEALIRWQHPREGFLAPGQFLPLIEGTPLEIALGEWVTTTALAQQQTWQEAGIRLAVSINISPRHIQMPSFVDFLARTLIDYPAGADGALEIEILEISEIDDIGNAAQVMNACKALGVHFALDDFGTGYS